MNLSKRLYLIVTILSLFGVGIFFGCTTNNEESSSQNQATSAPSSQPELTGTNEVDDSSAATASTAVDETLNSSDEESLVSETQKPDTVLILTEKPVTTLHPYLMTNIHPDGSVALHLWDTLTLLNNELQIEPHLAQSWRLINNFTWEFDLRKDVTFHNGEPFDAQAVQFSVELAQSMPGSLETFVVDVDLDRVEIVDDYTIRFVTRQPVANLPYYLSFLEILPPKYYAQTNLEQLAVAPVGSGPYRLDEESLTKGQLLKLEAVPDYWKGPPVFPQLVFQVIPAEAERLVALMGEEIVLATDLSPLSANREDLPTDRIQAIESTQRVFVGIRTDTATPLGDKRVRQALNYGVNVEQIVDTWLDGYGMRYGSWVNPPSNNPDLTPWPYDPEMARQLLEEAGYTNGLTLTLRTPVDVYYHDVDIANTIAQQLAQIGVNVQVETVSNWHVYARDLLSGNTGDLFLLALNSHGDGLQDVKNLSTGYPFNLTGWRSDAFEELIERATGNFNDTSRARLLNEAQAIAYDEAPWIWLWRKYNFYGVSQNLDWKPRRDGLIYLYQPVETSAESEK